MFDKIKQFYTDHKDEVHGAAFVVLGGLLVVGGVSLKRSYKANEELQTFHDDIYTALKNGFGVVLDSESGNDYTVRLVDPATEAIGAVADVAVAAIEASTEASSKKGK